MVKCWRLRARILLVLRSIQCEISSNEGSLNCLNQVCTRNSVRNVVHVFSDYVERTRRAAGGKVERHTREARLCWDDLPVDDAIDEAAERVGIVDEVLLADENIYVNVLKACMEIEDFFTFKDAFRGMVARGVARTAGFGSAIRYCHKHLDPVFLEEVLDVTRPSQGAVLAIAEKLVDSARHITMLEMVESQCNASIGEAFNLMDVFLEWKLTSNIQVFTSLLSIYMRRREVGNAVALIGAMEEHDIVPDVKAFTTVAFIHASRGDLKAVGDVLRDMASQGVATDRMLFDYVLNTLYGSCGIDICFLLLRELSANELAIPGGLYVLLIGLGTTIGLIERTVQIAYNMECEGYHLSSKQLYALIMRCHSDGEISEFVRTFVLLHQGVPPQTPRVEVEMYEDFVVKSISQNCFYECRSSTCPDLPTHGGGTPIRALLYDLVLTLCTRRLGWLELFVTALGDVDLAERLG
uniref:Pentatricopeptide repeat-containing protein n=1 Tax=Peronospora matthiolae TaxID=2874970 RepID=A0AAV1SZQ2_9STRA